MRFQFAALFGEQAAFCSSPFIASRWCRVDEHWALLPLPHLLSRHPRTTETFRFLDPQVAEWAAKSSYIAPIAWLEVDFDGPFGAQASQLWHNGIVIAGPFTADHAHRPVPPLCDWPINRVLRTLGVHTTPGRDEYDTLRLGRYRRLEHWIEPSMAATSRYVLAR